jgi:NTE family protein
MISQQKPKIALVLGGGGSRGIAHIGVLEILDQHNIPIDFIIGTSMGAIVGVAYALGYAPEHIADYLSESQGSVFSTNIFSAHARQRDLQRRLERVVRGRTFADLNIPTVVMAVDMIAGKEVILSTGNLTPAILASAAVPGVFPPVEIDGRQLADGGVIDSLATHVAYHYDATFVIAVDVYPPLEEDAPWVEPISSIMGFQIPFNPFSGTTWGKTPSIASSVWRASRVMTWYLHESRLKAHPPDVLLRPDVGNYGSLDFTDIIGPLAAGRLETLRNLDAIKAFIT